MVGQKYLFLYSPIKHSKAHIHFTRRVRSEILIMKEHYKLLISRVSWSDLEEPDEKCSAVGLQSDLDFSSIKN